MTHRLSWLLLCASFAALCLLIWPLPREALDWQPALATREPWRALTAAFVHWTPIHLAANLAGCAVLALLGHRAQLDKRETIAALIALPLTQLALLLRPDLHRYAGLSGELHALAAIAALSLIARPGRDRIIGAAIALGLIAKLALEHPLGPALSTAPGFDFPVAPFAHLAGAAAGLIAWGMTMRGYPRSPRSPHGT
ncbi:rhombosortase [Roseateles sp. LYH14W]|uniref:Rhombosortase n=1 Tax=Pelomonas parva TaxID=3299032 RepID=A0ABW7FBL3_9BURK